MSQFDERDLPPELNYVADQLRSHRYAASALELDEVKARIMKHARGPKTARGGAMRLKSLLTALIMFAAIGTGSAAALGVGGVSIPFITSPTTNHAVRSSPSAAIAQYGTLPTRTVVICRPTVITSGNSSSCTAVVADITRPTGTVTLSGQTCRLVPLTRSSSRCSVQVFARTAGRQRIRVVTVIGHYSGDAAHAPSRGIGRFVVRRSRRG